jgi:hypothetical protein
MGRPAMVIDCAEIAKAKNDSALVSALADQTGEATEKSVIDSRLLPGLLLPVFP